MLFDNPYHYELSMCKLIHQLANKEKEENRVNIFYISILSKCLIFFMYLLDSILFFLNI